jgi:hypothetical protein
MGNSSRLSEKVGVNFEAQDKISLGFGLPLYLSRLRFSGKPKKRFFNRKNRILELKFFHQLTNCLLTGIHLPTYRCETLT